MFGDFNVNLYSTNPINSTRTTAASSTEDDNTVFGAKTNFLNDDVNEVDYNAYDEFDEAAFDEDIYETDVCDISDEDMATYAEIFDMSESY